MRKTITLFSFVALLGSAGIVFANNDNDNEYIGPAPILANFSQALRMDRLKCLNWAYTKTDFMPTKKTLSQIRGGEEFLDEIRKFSEFVVPVSILGGTGFEIDLNGTYENSKNGYLDAYGACRLFQGYAIGMRPTKKSDED